MSLNVKKTTFIIFGNKKQLNAKIMLAGAQINRVTDSKFLGIVISSNLNWKKHTDVVVSKISKSIGIIAKVRHLLPTAAARTLYLTLVEPYINYCIIVWAQPDYSVNLDRIHKLQKNIAGF